MRKKKFAIKVDKNYYGVEHKTSYIVGSEKQIADQIQEAKENPHKVIQRTARADSTVAYPKLIVSPATGEYEDARIIAHFQYWADIQPRKAEVPVFPLIVIAFIAFMIMSIVALTQVAQRERISAMCKIYYRHGEPVEVLTGDANHPATGVSDFDRLLKSKLEIGRMGRVTLDDCARIYLDNER